MWYGSSIMAETLHSPETQQTFEEITNDALALGNSGHETTDETRTFDAARSIVDLPKVPDTQTDRYQIPAGAPREVAAPERTVSPETFARRRHIAVGVAAGVTGLTVAAVAALPSMLNNNESEPAPASSVETVDYIVSNGETLWSIADKIEGAGELGTDKRDMIAQIQTDPANTDVLEDGLQGGDTIKIPVSYE